MDDIMKTVQEMVDLVPGEQLLLVAGLAISLAGSMLVRPVVFAAGAVPAYYTGMNLASQYLPETNLVLIGTVAGLCGGFYALRNLDLAVVLLGGSLGALAGAGFMMTPYDEHLNELLPTSLQSNPLVIYGIFGVVFALLTATVKSVNTFVFTLFSSVIGALMVVCATDMLMGEESDLPGIFTSPLFLVVKCVEIPNSNYNSVAWSPLQMFDEMKEMQCIEGELQTERGRAALLTWTVASVVAMASQVMLRR